ncbi:hypothetical protein [Oceanobacillus timonensis]|uniref:hypothetical protein n=1 Tax=Oceanobacillus timonensis TaxID=1926285 RepID=UPI0009BC2F2E|nr:hypothetical protein [Oceanobacillus timonensis]
MDHDGVMKYHFVEKIPEERLKPPEVEEEDFFTELGNSFKKTVNNTVELGKDTVTRFENNQKELYDNKMNSFYDFSNYLTLGALDIGKDTYRGIVGYGENMLNSPADFANWLTMGGVDTAKGAIAPEDPNSKEHIANVLSLGTLMFIRRPTPSPDVPSPSSKPSGSQAVPQTDNNTNSSTASSFILPNGVK